MEVLKKRISLVQVTEPGTVVAGDVCESRVS